MKYSSSKVAPSNFVEQLEEKAPILKKSTNEENYFFFKVLNTWF